MNQWINELQINETKYQWINESVIQWITESMKQWTSGSKNQAIIEALTVNHWINERVTQCINESINQWMNEWRKWIERWVDNGGWMGGWVNFFSLWDTSSLSDLFAEAPLLSAILLLWAATDLGYFCSDLSPSQLFCSFCNPILLFAQLLQYYLLYNTYMCFTTSGCNPA